VSEIEDQILIASRLVDQGFMEINVFSSGAIHGKAPAVVWRKGE